MAHHPDAPGAIRAVHQFHSGSALGDAVTNSLLLTQRFLKELGFASEIFVEHIGAGLEGQLRAYREWQPAGGEAFIVHHSMGHDLTEWVLRLPSPKVLLYHNITPAEFFPPHSEQAKYSAIGRKQLNAFRGHFAAAICDSELNAAELRALGYANVSVVPLLLDLAQLRAAPWVAQGEGDTEAFTVLFVGRIVPNKCQHDLIEVIGHLARMTDRRVQLVLVGSYEANGDYFRRLTGLIASRGLQGRVRFTGRVSNEELIGWYRRADALLCLSEHEGFGVPLIEAMVFDLPAIAFDAASVGWTMGGAGVLLKRKALPEIAGLLAVLSEDRALRRALVRGQRERIAAFEPDILISGLRDALASTRIWSARKPVREVREPAPLWQIEGPFETSYSLALVNRELARTLDQREPGAVALFATEGPGDYAPKREDLARHSELEPLWRRGRKGAPARRVLRTLYPPRVHDEAGLTRLLYFFWEESVVPAEWVESFNHHLDGIVVATRFVKKALIDSGVEVPIAVVGCGVDHILRERPVRGPELPGGFRFLHVSSAFPRKGVDALLEAYGRAFTSKDDVSLVLKTFPNIHNTVEQQLAGQRRRNPAYPHVTWIDEDLTAPRMIDLYQRCHALVMPSRGEGFGLPQAEAMLLGLPVITTASGGQADFCTEETSWLVDCVPAPAETHFGQHDSIWFDPDVAALASAMHDIRRATAAQRQARVERARERIMRDYCWDAVASKVAGTANALEVRPAPLRRRLKLAWVSSWNTKCGIASYSEYLLRPLRRDFDLRIFASRLNATLGPDGEEVRRCWDDLQGPSLDDLDREMERFEPDVVVVQFNFGFFPLAALGRLLSTLKQRGATVVVTFHATRDVDRRDLKLSLRTIREDLARCDRLLVHGLADLRQLQAFGLRENVTLFPQGVPDAPAVDRRAARQDLGIPEGLPLIATYGFLLPPKGSAQIIEALALMRRQRPEAQLLMVNALYPNPVSGEQLARCRAAIDRLGLRGAVTLITDFLRDEQSLHLLRCADLIVFPYQDTGESSSAAVRFGLSSRRPVAVTPIPIFDDVRPAVHTLPGVDPEAIARGVLELISDVDLLQGRTRAQGDWLKAHAWPSLSRRLRGLIRGLIAEAKLGNTQVNQLTSPEEPDAHRVASAS